MHHTSRFVLLLTWALCCCQWSPASEGGTLLNGDNMRELKCSLPLADYRLVGGSAPGNVFVGDEQVDLQFAFSKGALQGVTAFALEIQEIGTRTPGKVLKTREGWSDTCGYAPIVDLFGKPVRHDFSVTFGDQLEQAVNLKDVPVPKRYGTYALILVHPPLRQLICTVARVPSPHPQGTIDNTPILGDGSFVSAGDMAMRAKIYARMGIRGWRSEGSWNEGEDGSLDWKKTDALFASAKQAGCKVMITLGAHPSWTWPFGSLAQTPAAVGPNWDGNPYMGQCDWLCDPRFYPRYQAWITTFCQRYWQDGQGALWGLENFNEPWEGGGISGWARDIPQYRELQKVIARAARSVSPDLRVLAASSIMNTEDKFYSDGSKEFDHYVDIFTDHYVPPCMSYGPMVARSRGKESMETETWYVGTEYQVPQVVAQFMATGQRRISPWHERVLFEKVVGGTAEQMMPTPVVAATAAFNRLVSGHPFEKMVFLNHLPYVFQFGPDDAPDSLLVLIGQLVSNGGSDPKEVLWSQVNSAVGGEITINNADGLLQFYDLAGNPAFLGQAQVVVSLNTVSTYITCSKGPLAAKQRLAQAPITNKRPVEILPHDFSMRVDSPTAELVVNLHNCLTQSVAGTLTVTTPGEITLSAHQQQVDLKPGETKTVRFAIKQGKPQESNAYPCSFSFMSPAGNAEYREVLSAAIVPKARIVVDGNLDEWKAVPPVSVFASRDQIDPSELMRRPWLQAQGGTEEIVGSRVRLAWDEGHLYVCAEVNDRTPEAHGISFANRDENAFFHTAGDDERPPFKNFLERPRPELAGKSFKDLGRSFSQVPYVYANSPEAGIPFRRDRLQVAFDTSEGWHDLASTVSQVPYGYHAVPDTDYEYSLYWCDDGRGEVWRHMAPGLPRVHDFPRMPRGALTTGKAEAVPFSIKRTEAGYVYEAAFPRTELAQLTLAAGNRFGFAFKIGNSGGPQPVYGQDKAVCKANGLTLHPYWERSPSTGVRWTLVE